MGGLKTRGNVGKQNEDWLNTERDIWLTPQNPKRPYLKFRLDSAYERGGDARRLA